MTILELRPGVPAATPDTGTRRAGRELDADPDHVASVLAAMVTRVALDHPEVDLEDLHVRAARAYARFEGAPVQGFREILSERAVRRDLLVARASGTGDAARGDR